MTAQIRHAALPWLAIACGLAALALRRPGWEATAVLLMIGVVGLTVPVPRSAAMSGWLVVAGVGVAAFAVARFAGGGVGAPVTAMTLVANTGAAVAEELVFRRALYGRLERHGPMVAVLVTAVLFGVVHAPLYGWGVVPVDVAAGLLFGWQRWASGTWTAPAATHVLANLMG